MHCCILSLNTTLFHISNQLHVLADDGSYSQKYKWEMFAAAFTVRDQPDD
jgi:hypothetical protein